MHTSKAWGPNMGPQLGALVVAPKVLRVSIGYRDSRPCCESVKLDKQEEKVVTEEQ